ncbi:13931_t:CDS:2 [Gigaspora margarita]|uniref:13931_t:CDS:1 n=1 Tax=Gigaspora margarita TaxID=4874 RepID=A0ABN7UY35_GIGMA|nr:13931_t:CDS:2 [Gigaspora margarita]
MPAQNVDSTKFDTSRYMPLEETLRPMQTVQWFAPVFTDSHISILNNTPDRIEEFIDVRKFSPSISAKSCGILLAGLPKLPPPKTHKKRQSSQYSIPNSPIRQHSRHSSSSKRLSRQYDKRL